MVMSGAVPEGSPDNPALPGQSGQGSEWVWLARLRHPQGRKGEILAEILTDFPEKFSERRQLWLLAEAGGVHSKAPAAPRSVELIAHWLHKGGIVLHFAGVGSISEAETLTGRIVAIPRAERAVLPEDEVYIGDLIGCTLVDLAQQTDSGSGGVVIGSIEDVDRSAGPVALLVVEGAAGEILVPFAKNYLRKLDLAARRVEMELPAGLVDLNSPEKH
jgi:16S rRNA processing protein RimM